MDLSALTLAEIEVLANRLRAAAETIRDAQSLLGGPPRPMTLTSITTTDESTRPPTVVTMTPARGGDNPLLTAAENAERRRLIRLNTEPIDPNDLEAMERA